MTLKDGWRSHVKSTANVIPFGGQDTFDKPNLVPGFQGNGATGFVMEQMAEPRPSAALIKQIPKLQNADVVAYFLQICCRKPA